MKIARKDLDKNVIEKLEQFDAVVEAYDDSLPDGVVGYGKNGFYLKKMNDSFLRRIYSEDDIVSLVEGLYKPKSNIKSSMFTDMRLDKTLFIKGTTNVMHDLSLAEGFSFNSEVVLSKHTPDGVLILTQDGVIRELNSGINLNINLLELIKKNNLIGQDISIFNIVDICQSNADEILVATDYYGIYKVTISTKAISLLLTTNSVRKIEIAHNNTSLFVATDKNVTIYDLESGMKIESYHNLLTANQKPFSIIKTIDKIFVIGVPGGLQNIDRYVHCWKLDKAGVGYNLIDSEIPPQTFDSHYEIKYTGLLDDNIFIAGRKDDLTFIWKLNNETLEFSEEFIDCVVAKDIKDLFLMNDKTLILTNDHFYLVSENQIVLNAKVSTTRARKFFFYNGVLFIILRHEIAKLEIPTMLSLASASFLVFDENESCNNIDVLVKGVTSNEKVILYDYETEKEIAPAYSLRYNGCYVAKLSNCTSKKIFLTIALNNNSFIEGIVVKRNKLYSK